jgi:hypothetical protein
VPDIEGALWAGRIGVTTLLSRSWRGHLAGETTPSRAGYACIV